MERITAVSISEFNEHGYGFTAKVSVDASMPKYISFDIAWQTQDDDGTVQDEESVGVLMSAEAASLLAERLQHCSYQARSTNDTKEPSIYG